MDTSKIDDSDLVAIEVYMIFAEGLLFAIAGFIYIQFGMSIKRNFGFGCLGITLFLWIQALLMRKFYMIAMENAKDSDKTE
jgi:hypothetical protein